MTAMKTRHILRPGDGLAPGEELISANGVFRLRHDEDGSLVLLAKRSGDTWSATWRGAPATGAAGRVRFDAADVLVVEDAHGRELRPCAPWASPDSPEDATLVLQDDGNLVAYASQSPFRDPYWASDTWNGRFAVLIGVEDYASFPDEGLRAGRNDVLAMWKVCRRLGYQPEHIRIRTSPRLTPEDLERAEVERLLALPEGAGQNEDDLRPRALENLESAAGVWDEVLGDATHDAIAVALTWLQAQLAGPFERQHGYLVPGILYYSGHGTKLDGELALCPSDTGRDGMNALPFADVEEALTAGYARDSSLNPIEHLTVILDCCYAAADAARAGASPNQRVTALDLSGGTSSPPSKPLRAIHPWLQRRVFCATRDDEGGHQAVLGGRWHGAFTWAITRTLEQWTTKQSSSDLFPYVDISHVELLMRTRMLLEALGFRQHPVLMDTFANTPVFWSGLARVEAHRPGAAPPTSATPTAWRLGIQIDPTGWSAAFLLLQFRDAANRLLGEGVVPTADRTVNGATWLAAKEYWRVVEDGTISSLTASGVSTPPAAITSYTLVNRAATWAATTETPTLVFGGSSAFGVTASFRVGQRPSLTWFSDRAADLRFTAGTYPLTSVLRSFGFKAS